MLATYEEYEPHTIWECYSPEAHTPFTVPKGSDTVRSDFCGWSALGPISIYIEEVLGFHTVNAFERVVEWQKPDEFKNAVGIKNLRFADVVTDILARGNACTVRSNGHFTLEINGRAFQISPGEQAITL